jgi:hypothetical protein
MKTTKLIAGFSVFFLAAILAHAQGAFKNLNFESASIPTGTPVDSLISISEALPDWSASYTSSLSGTESATQVGYDFISIGGPVISVIDNNAPVFAPLQGDYSAFLFGGVGTSATISQTAKIPAGTESLMMDAWSYEASPIVAINGQAINMIPLQNISFYTVYGGTVPAADVGPSVTLSFTEPPPPSGGPSMFELDNIAFSQVVVSPEPNIVVLTAIGGLLFAARKWFARC